jgi:hypothetical protein
MKSIERVPVNIVKYLKKVLKVKTYVIEYIFVATVLIVVALVSKKGMVEWLGVLAVFLTFGHTSIADRLHEREANRYSIDKKVEVNCYWKLNYYFVAKEVCWFVYFYLLGAWSALVGVVVFLLYPLWRKLWRKYKPLN